MIITAVYRAAGDAMRGRHVTGPEPETERLPRQPAPANHQGAVVEWSVRLCDPMAAARQAPLSMGFSRQDWSGLSFPSPEDLPDPGIEPGSSALQADSLPAELPGKPHTRRQGSIKIF